MSAQCAVFAFFAPFAPSRLSQVMAAPVQPARCAHAGAVLEERKTRRREGRDERENRMLVKVAALDVGWRSKEAKANVCRVRNHAARSLPTRKVAPTLAPSSSALRCLIHSARSPLQPH